MRPTPPRTLFRQWKRLLSACAAIYILTVPVVTSIALYTLSDIIHQLPSLDPINQLTGNSASTIVDSQGNIMRIWGDEQRTPIDMNHIPTNLARAIISTEDKTFWTNDGIDINGIIRAAIWDKTHPHQRPKGASTITQQLIKNTITGNQPTIRRKINEAILAIKLTKEWPKKRILTAYMNSVYLGERFYGVEAAAQGYFHVHANDLDLAQSATIAGIFKAPDNYNPIRHPNAALQRRNIVIDQMLHNKVISADEATAAIQTPLNIASRQGTANDGKWAGDEAIREGIQSLKNAGGQQALSSNGLTITTTIDPTIQNIVETTLHNGIEKIDMEYNGWHGTIGQRENNNTPWPNICQTPPMTDWKCAVSTNNGTYIKDVGYTQDHLPKYIHINNIFWINHKDNTWTPVQVPKIAGGAILMNPKNGAIIAMAGGWNYTPGGFNHATQAMRQPGSSFKPFLALAALEQHIPPNALFLDGAFRQEDVYGHVWTPQDYERTTAGMVPLHQALRDSLNIPMVRVAEEIGLDRFTEIATKSYAAPNIYPALSSALGTNETTMLRLASGYSMIANGGHIVIPHIIASIRDFQTNELLPPTTPPKSLVSDTYTYQLTSILKDVLIHGTGASVGQGITGHYAGKTGTSQDQRDAWFVGYNPNRVLIVWIGYDHPQNIGHGATGGKVAGPIWHDIIRQLPIDNSDFPIPSDIHEQLWSISNDTPCHTPNRDCVMGAFTKDQGTNDVTPQPFYDPNPDTTPSSAMPLAKQHGDEDDDNTDTDTPNSNDNDNNDATTDDNPLPFIANMKTTDNTSTNDTKNIEPTNTEIPDGRDTYIPTPIHK